MNVILIYEDNHGLVGIANNYYNAAKWLITNNWITDNTEICIGKNEYSYKWTPIKNALGEDWADKMLDLWDIDNFNDYWEGSFHLKLVEVFQG